MFRIAKFAAPDQKVVRKFQFISTGRGAATLDVTLEYTPPETLNEQLDQEQTRIVGQRKFGAMEDLRETQLAVKTAWHMILASRVHRVDGLTLRKLSTLISLDPAAIAAAGGLDQEVPGDPSDTTEISPEDREKFDTPKDVKTVGQQASRNIFYLINAVADFRTFLETILRDVGYFQDKEWESQIKN